MNKFFTMISRKKTIIVLLFFVLILLAGMTSYSDYGISWDEPIQREHGLVAYGYIVDSIIPSLKSLEIFKGIPAYPEYPHKYPVLFHLPLMIIEDALSLDPEGPDLWQIRHLYTYLWFYVGLIFFYRLLSRKYGWFYGLLGCLFMFLSPRIFAHSFFNVKDLVFLSTVMIVFYFAFRFLESKDIKRAIQLSLALAVSINIRIIGLMFLGLVVLFVLVDWAMLYREKYNVDNKTFILILLTTPVIVVLALLISLAIINIYLIPVVALIIVLVYRIKSKTNLNKIINHKEYLSMHFLLFPTICFTTLFWPVIWEDPFRLFINYFVLLSNYPLFVYNLYLGNYVLGSEVPWHYIPVWISVTTPILYILLFIAGSVFSIKDFIKEPFRSLMNKELKESLFCLLSFCVPVFAAIVLGSTLYGGWRHQFFIYVPFVVLAIKGIQTVFIIISGSALLNKKKKLLIAVLMIFVSINIAYTASWMYSNHPYQYVYFNALAGSDVSYTFERDYWGVAVRDGLDYIVQNDDRDDITVYNRLGHISRNISMLNLNDQKRLVIAAKDEADYIIESYRGPGNDTDDPVYIIDNFRNYMGECLADREVFAIEVNDMPIMSVFDMREKIQ